VRHSTNLARRPVVAALAALLMAGSLVSCKAARSGSTAVPRSFYGIVQSGPLDERDFVRMDRAGVGSLRFEINWTTVETAPGNFDWSSADPTVLMAAEHRLDLLPILVGTPSFVAPRCPTCGARIQVRTRAQRAAWQRFLRAAVHRYEPGGSFWQIHPEVRPDPITRWQIWNEQNNPVYRDPAGVYARLLGLSRRAIDSVEPNGEVVLGGMFGTPVGSRRGGVTAWSYLRRLYDHGAGDAFDVVALHPYAPNLAGIKFQIKKIRAVLKEHHDAETPILITELGWGSGGNQHRHPGTGSRGQVFVVGPERQRKNLTNSFNLLTSHRASWKIAGVYWFTWKDPKDPPPGLCAFCYSDGLYKANGKTAKPALSAYESFTRNTRAH
jgi:polysaccharide biosynthesis protein PslG